MAIFRRRASEPNSTDQWALPIAGASLPRDFVSDRLAFARGHANWYRRKKRGLQFISKTLRLFAIAFITAGGIVPLLAQTGLPVPAEFGYVLLALGGACLLADRIFGVSSGWARYMVAAMDIEGLAEVFRARAVELESGSSPDCADLIMSLCKDFTVSINEVISAETDVWVKDFSNSRDELARLSSAGVR